MSVDLEQLDEWLKVEFNQLDTHLVNQPELYRMAADGCAVAVSQRDEAKRRLEETKSELYAAFREQMEEAGQKPTEKSVEAKVLTSEEYNKAYRDWIDAKLEADYWGSMKDAFNQRAHVLRELTNLFISGFFQSDVVETKESPRQKLHEYYRHREKEKRQSVNCNSGGVDNE